MLLDFSVSVAIKYSVLLNWFELDIYHWNSMNPDNFNFPLLSPGGAGDVPVNGGLSRLGLVPSRPSYPSPSNVSEPLLPQ